jgi:hypothetical protein
MRASILLGLVLSASLAACDGGGGTETTVRTPGGSSGETIATGVPELDHVVNSALAGNFLELAGLTGYQMIGCVEEAEGLSSPPVCRQGEDVGQEVEGFPTLRCELVWLRPEVMTDTYREAIGESPEVFAVYGSAERPLVLSSDYVAVLRTGGDDAEPAGVALSVLEGRVISLEYSCGDFATLSAPERVQDFIIAPAANGPEDATPAQ